ncbi:hypothetical protein [Sphingomonas sp. TREG-RG-20F-R18-01]|uniref:hypothetical protein n=1 Tax=Sphingomonas sp. TREG-RG-20F-R18-01 TaxID=2914982 RepID=UPI001F563A62|nr:hypothetical protein [Sphingomonas sp. TREG-RG-20F-R18-01]
MVSANELADALDAARVAARAEYRQAVIALAGREAAKDAGPDRAPADVDRLHHARTRVIALDAARDELSQMIDEGAPLIGD